MRNFVRQGGRAASPSHGQATVSAERQAAAANAKVPMKRTNILGRPSSQKDIALRQAIDGHANTISAQRLSGPGHSEQHGDQYDTDAESLDTTVLQSNIQSDDNPLDGRHQIQGTETDEDRQDDEGADDEEVEYAEEHGDDIYSEDITDEQLIDKHHLHYLNLGAQQQIIKEIRHRNGLAVVKGDSYPNTSIADDSANNIHEPYEQGMNNLDNSRRVYLPQTPAPTSPHSFRVFNEPFQHPHGAEEVAYAPQKQLTIFQTGADLRSQQRSNIQPVVRGVAMYPSSLPAPTTVQPPMHSQTHRGHGSNSSVQVNRSHSLVLQNANLPNGSQQPLDSLSDPPAKRSSSPSEISGAQIPQYHVGNHREEGAAAKPVEDYDKDVLFKKTYQDLKNESFDFIPRAAAPVLSDDMLQQSLDKRLEHIKKHFEPEGQVAFFSTLSTVEWEEAGDWFLDSFSSIIQRTKNVRQHKRKLAREFENEIDQRFQQVSKKQEQVQGALNKMKAQGESLVPRSPRPSKSPRQKRS